MKNRISILLISIIFCSCSSTNLVYLSVQKPAPVTIPSYIKNVGIVNRTLPTSQTKAIDVVDKVFSLEGANMDKEGAQATITGLTDELMKNNRFTAVKSLTNVDLRTGTPGLFPIPLSWDEVEKICRDNNMDALFALELFDTDNKISFAANPTTLHTVLGNVPGVETQANMQTLVKTGWRIYDPVGKNILDEFPISRSIGFTAKGINPTVAASGLIGRTDAVKEVGSQVGQCYAQRIIPYWIRVSRDYFVRGSDNFILATRKARSGNWNEAAELWQKETTNSNRKIAGRAYYNMAIISEINGDLDQAIQWAQKSYENYNIRIALDYVHILQYRKTNSDVLKDQQSDQ
ncbi:MAG TPA: DUF6340 family protein [Puia sp.]|nr:DUF6340 family protein [Puia sp.]